MELHAPHNALHFVKVLVPVVEQHMFELVGRSSSKAVTYVFPYMNEEPVMANLMHNALFLFTCKRRKKDESECLIRSVRNSWRARLKPVTTRLLATRDSLLMIISVSAWKDTFQLQASCLFYQVYSGLVPHSVL